MPKTKGFSVQKVSRACFTAKMKLEVETIGKEVGEVKFRESFGWGATSPISSTKLSNDSHGEYAHKEIQYLMKSS